MRLFLTGGLMLSACASTGTSSARGGGEADAPFAFPDPKPELIFEAEKGCDHAPECQDALREVESKAEGAQFADGEGHVASTAAIQSEIYRCFLFGSLAAVIDQRLADTVEKGELAAYGCSQAKGTSAQVDCLVLRAKGADALRQRADPAYDAGLRKLAIDTEGKSLFRYAFDGGYAFARSRLIDAVMKDRLARVEAAVREGCAFEHRAVANETAAADRECGEIAQAFLNAKREWLLGRPIVKGHRPSTP